MIGDPMDRKLGSVCFVLDICSWTLLNLTVADVYALFVFDDKMKRPIESVVLVFGTHPNSIDKRDTPCCLLMFFNHGQM